MKIFRQSIRRFAGAAVLGLAIALSAAPTGADDMEETYWAMIRFKAQQEFFENYLKRYPAGAHAEEARARIAALAGAGATTTPADTAQPVDADAAMERGVAARSRGDHAEALEAFAIAARAGSAAAHLQLANMYELGEGVDRNYTTAMEHLLAAAGLGSIDGYAAAINAKSVDYEPQSTYDPDGAARLLLELSGIDLDAALAALDRLAPGPMRSLQQLLAEDGFYASKIDGETGPGSRNALAAYAATAPAAPASQPAPAAPVSAATITRNGVGALTAATPFDAAALRAALPGYEIKIKQVSNEGMLDAFFVAMKDGSEAIRIEGIDGHVAVIRIRVAGMADDAGMVIGRSTFADFTGPVEDRCMVLEGKENSTVSCQADNPALTYRFAVNEAVFADADDRLHRSSVPKSALLTAIIWYPAD